ncbi:hypothetical protein BH24ACT15_BH24ACT15_37980 [soil metagenome]
MGRAVAGLATVDRAMASILRAVADAGPVDGLPAVRLISLAASATGWDIRYLRRTTETLSAMPGVWAAFDSGQISWSQVRGITTAAKGLSVADRHTLDGQLSGAIADNATAEPDRIVEVAGDLAARLDDAAQQRHDTNSAKGIGLRLIPDLFGGATLHGQLDDQLAALVSNAIHGAADAPVADDHQPVDADGKPIPRSWLAPTRRAAQLAEALGRVCAEWLAGRTGFADDVADDHSGIDHASEGGGSVEHDDSEIHSSGRDEDVDGAAGTKSADSDAPDASTGGAGRGAQPAALVIVDLNDLIEADRRDHTSDGTPATTARLLWRLAGGRRRQSNARIHALTCDATYIPVLTDGNIPIAVGDANDPIPLAIRRAATARDQGCRFPGCDRPAQFTDLHHVIWREHGGPTELSNLVSLCRTCHNLVHQHGWQMTLYDDGRLTVRRGRYQFTSRPRLRPPPPGPPPRPTRSSATGPPAHAPPADPGDRLTVDKQGQLLPF